MIPVELILTNVLSRLLPINQLVLMWTSGIISSEIATTWHYKWNLTTGNYGQELLWLGLVSIVSTKKFTFSL